MCDILTFKGDTMEKRCKNYVGVVCVDGTCPKANIDEYEERCIPVIKNCLDCHFYRGCEDCALSGTVYCDVKVN